MGFDFAEALVELEKVKKAVVEVPLATVKARINRHCIRNGLKVEYVGARGESRGVVVNGIVADLEKFARANGILDSDEEVKYSYGGYKNVKNGLLVPVTVEALVRRLRRKMKGEFRDLEGSNPMIKVSGEWVAVVDYAVKNGVLKDFERVLK